MENEFVKEKSNKGLIVAVVILSLIVVGLGGYLIYDNFFKDDKKKEEINNNESQNDEIVFYEYTDLKDDSVQLYLDTDKPKSDGYKTKKYVLSDKYNYVMNSNHASGYGSQSNYDIIFKSNIVAYNEDDKYGLINYKDGSVSIPFEYSDIICYDNSIEYLKYPISYCKANTNSGYEIYKYNSDTNNITVLNTKYDDLYSIYKNEILYAKINGELAVVDVKTDQVLDKISFDNSYTNNCHSMERSWQAFQYGDATNDNLKKIEYDFIDGKIVKVSETEHYGCY